MVSKRSKPKKRAVKSTKVKEEVKDNSLDPATVGVKVLGTIGTGAAIYHLRNKGGGGGTEEETTQTQESSGFFGDHLQEFGIAAVAATVLAGGFAVYFCCCLPVFLVLA